MPLLLLIRHAENDFVRTGRLAGRQPGVHLNENGRMQAEALGSRLSQFPLNAIYSSPLERTQETAAPLAQALGLPVILRPGLIEVDCGKWQGRTLKSLRRLKVWKVVQYTPCEFRFPEGESFPEVQARICQEIDALCSQHGEKEVLACFSHADPIRLALAYYLGMPLDAFQRLVIAPTAVAVLNISEKGSKLLAINVDVSQVMPHP